MIAMIEAIVLHAATKSPISWEMRASSLSPSSALWMLHLQRSRLSAESINVTSGSKDKVIAIVTCSIMT